MKLESRFSDSHKGLIAAQYLVPVQLNKLTESQVDAIYTYYGKLMTYSEKTNLVAEVAKKGRRVTIRCGRAGHIRVRRQFQH